MVFERHIFLEKASGSEGHRKDRWTLMIRIATGEKLVQREWSLDNRARGSSPDGAETVSLGEFLRSPQDDEVMHKLRKLLMNIGLSDA